MPSEKENLREDQKSDLLEDLKDNLKTMDYVDKAAKMALQCGTIFMKEGSSQIEVLYTLRALEYAADRMSPETYKTNSQIVERTCREAGVDVWK